jgi:hypothetical protein
MKGAEMSKIVTKNTSAEELIKSSPQVLDYLVRKGVCGIRCEFPITGTLEQMAKEKDFSESEIEKTLSGLNNLMLQLE